VAMNENLWKVWLAIGLAVLLMILLT